MVAAAVAHCELRGRFGASSVCEIGVDTERKRRKEISQIIVKRPCVNLKFIWPGSANRFVRVDIIFHQSLLYFFFISYGTMTLRNVNQLIWIFLFSITDCSYFSGLL